MTTWGCWGKNWAMRRRRGMLIRGEEDVAEFDPESRANVQWTKGIYCYAQIRTWPKTLALE